MSNETERAEAVSDRFVSPGGRLVTVDGRVLPLRSVALRGETSGGLARVTLEQRFRNPYPDPLRVTYQLPLPAEAAVSGYAFRIGERRVVGEVDRVESARERFEQAVLEGRPAGLVEQDRSSLFTQEIGNIPPGVEVVAELVIDQRLRWLEEGAWEWRFPTTVAPRYLGAQERVPDAERITQDVADGPLAIAATLGLTIRDALAAGHQPESPSHGITVAGAAGGLVVRLSDDGRSALDRDLVVRWRAAQPRVAIGLDTGRLAAGRGHAADSYGLVTITPPDPDERPASLPRDLIVLLDISGSMTGEPIDQARQVVARLIDTLGDQDQLELIAFAAEPHRWKSRPISATAAARQDARRWLDGLHAGGSTEMCSSVVEALRPLRGEAQRQVVLISDGQIGFESEVVGLITRDLPAGCRLHTVGVGPAVNRTLTAGAARAGRGAEIVLGLREDPTPAVARLLTRLEAPLLTELAVSGSALLDHAPARLPDVHAASPVLVSVRLRPEGGELRVTGRLAGKPWEGPVSVPTVAAGAGNSAVPVRYAREAVEDLEMRRAAGETGGVDQQIERLGLEFQIATRLTSWIAISEEPAVDPRQPTRRERIPQSLPEWLSVEGLGLPHGRQRLIQRMGASLSAPPRMAERALYRMPAPPTTSPRSSRTLMLTGRLVLRRARYLLIEITLERPLDWKPSRSRVVGDDGVERRSAIDGDLTTRPGTCEAGQVIRLVLVMEEDAGSPAQVLLDSGAVSLVVLLES